MIRRYIGDRAFYRRVFSLMIPIMLQNGITNFVNMLDNVMVGSVGTTEMTGVAVANQLFFVFNLCIFGAVSGAGIFTAQYYGKGDTDGVRDTFRVKIVFSLILTAIVTAVFLLWDRPLVQLYLSGEGDVRDAAACLDFAQRYIRIMLIGLLPYALTQSFSGTLRETDNALPPLITSSIAVLINLVLNYCLIFGNFGFPKLGVEGAAVATVVSRFAELFILGIWTRLRSRRNAFIVGAFRSLRVSFSLIRQIFFKGAPLMVNETMWSIGIAIINQCYSVRGLNVVSANTICQTFYNIFSVAFIAVGCSIGVIIGQLLGAGKFEEAKDADRKLIAFSVFISAVTGVMFFLLASVIPLAYNTSEDIRSLATGLMQITALVLPIDAFAHSSYFTLRSGGKTFITILFDSGFVWVFSMPLAFCLSRFTAIPILPLFATCQFVNIFKDILGYAFVKRGSWLQNIVSDH